MIFQNTISSSKSSKKKVSLSPAPLSPSCLNFFFFFVFCVKNSIPASKCFISCCRSFANKSSPTPLTDQRPSQLPLVSNSYLNIHLSPAKSNAENTDSGYLKLTFDILLPYPCVIFESCTWFCLFFNISISSAPFLILEFIFDCTFKLDELSVLFLVLTSP